MTGFGQGECATSSKRYVCELQSVNHRYLDVRARLPKRLSALELQILKTLQGRFARGRFDVTVLEELTGEQSCTLRLNRPLAHAYLDAAKTLQSELGLTGEVTLELLLSRSDLFDLEGEESGAGDADWVAVRTALEGAMNAVVEMRREEGKALEADLLGHLDLVEATLATIVARAPEVVQSYKNRLELRLQRLLEGKSVDPGRLEQEVAILAERSDIAEETTRVTSHLRQFRDLIQQQGPHGRRMEFLLQEMQREVNTIGAKANDAKTSHDVITLKSILEQLREQVQNVE
ncbi:YicC/YloC family endoribonuclease [Candidatus Methylomirabilis sp.]|uniref:YicC/YloC family endoribonuclease n=1 Tax=Candidatus Methylomirabilis sp. TaxID=2032687 RepID=UPI002A66EE20|nr:YicC family protein [Candidatus Methylomirabilis sp.]